MSPFRPDAPLLAGLLLAAWPISAAAQETDWDAPRADAALDRLLGGLDRDNAARRAARERAEERLRITDRFREIRKQEELVQEEYRRLLAERRGSDGERSGDRDRPADPTLEILRKVAAGTISPEDAHRRLSEMRRRESPRERRPDEAERRLADLERGVGDRLRRLTHEFEDHAREADRRTEDLEREFNVRLEELERRLDRHAEEAERRAEELEGVVEEIAGSIEVEQENEFEDERGEVRVRVLRMDGAERAGETGSGIETAIREALGQMRKVEEELEVIEQAEREFDGGREEVGELEEIMEEEVETDE